MLRIRKLYTEPALIDPISFFDGLNFILGVESDDSKKNNAVGKSLSIEFINFALLKKKTDSRVTLIPQEVFPKETKICLDIDLAGEKYTLKRSIENEAEPILISDNKTTNFSSLDDAKIFLAEKLFSRIEKKHPNFRTILGPLIRDEKSEFKSLVGCYDTDRKASDDYSPHLFLFGLDIDVYLKIKSAIKQMDDLNKDITKIKNSVKLLRGKELADARSDLNELDSEVQEIEKNIDALENIAGYEFVKDDIIDLEIRLENLRREKSLLKQKLSRTKLIADGEMLDTEEIGDFYEHMSSGLGDLIKKDLKEVYNFQKKIDEFQNQLISERRTVLTKNIEKLSKEIKTLDHQYSEKLRVLDQKGKLRNLKQTYTAFQAKNDEASQLRAFINKYDQLLIDKQSAKSFKESQLLQLQSDILVAKEKIQSFEDSILTMHEYIQGNRKASFGIEKSGKKQVIEIDMRTDDDGSHSVDRLKVFLYDLALLLNEHTSKIHPGVLIHDCIFDVDQDTLIKSIKFLIEEAEFKDKQQYILTLNSDRLDSQMRDLLEPFVRAEFTKNNRFLKTQYQELH